MNHFYRINGINKLINLHHVASISLSKKIVSINYNSTSLHGFLLFGSGNLDSVPNKEDIYCENEKQAKDIFEDIYDDFSKNK